MNTLYWSVRRRSCGRTDPSSRPPIVGGVVLFWLFHRACEAPCAGAGRDIGEHASGHRVALRHRRDDADGHAACGSIFYCLDALYGERRDRSLLFWKSMPVSDLTTVLAKALIPMLVLPLLTWAITVATQTVMLSLSGAVLAANGLDASLVSSHLSLSGIVWYNAGHLVAFHGLWVLAAVRVAPARLGVGHACAVSLGGVAAGGPDCRRAHCVQQPSRRPSSSGPLHGRRRTVRRRAGHDDGGDVAAGRFSASSGSVGRSRADGRAARGRHPAAPLA